MRNGHVVNISCIDSSHATRAGRRDRQDFWRILHDSTGISRARLCVWALPISYNLTDHRQKMSCYGLSHQTIRRNHLLFQATTPSAPILGAHRFSSFVPVIPSRLENSTWHRLGHSNKSCFLEQIDRIDHLSLGKIDLTAVNCLRGKGTLIYTYIYILYICMYDYVCMIMYVCNVMQCNAMQCNAMQCNVM